ncbi:helix-turn-helix domain-containing protein [Saccharothrix violaceirubra]|uniref:DNA-binding IclR family transcriptional regulator n=1 Tax=Saccharothrix violaceirubra TaxID=413306 RepID=A0A7W7T1D6_9PSEU|nr:DNA-binding IclR family transcriptional regulator [Saccharothrix violaceirubra]
MDTGSVERVTVGTSVSRSEREGNERGEYLARALRVLEVVAAADEPMALSDVCRRLSLPMTTVHRLLGALCRTGVLRRDGRRRYSMGVRIAVVGDPR